VARRLDDPACLGMVLSLACFCFWQMDTLAERLALATELFELAQRLGDPVLEVEAGVALYYAAVAHGDIHQGREALAVATRAAEEIGQPAPRLRAIVAHQSCAMLDGRSADYTRFAAEAHHLGEALGNTDRAINYHGDTGTMRLLQGRVDEAIEGFSAMLEDLPLLRTFLVWPYAEAGRLSEAAAIVASIGGSTLRDVPGGFARLLILALLAPACGPLGDRALARRLYDELLPHREEIALGQVSNIGPVAHYLGLLAAVLDQPEDADEHFAFAADLAERTGARGNLVRTRLEWARLLLTRDGPGDSERARDLAAAALELAGELDSPDLGRQASALLADGTRSGASMTEGG